MKNLIVAVALLVGSCESQTITGPDCFGFPAREMFYFVIAGKENLKQEDFTLHYEFSLDSTRTYPENFIDNDTFEIALEYSTKFNLYDNKFDEEYTIVQSVTEIQDTECWDLLLRRITVNDSLICENCDLKNTYHVN